MRGICQLSVSGTKQTVAFLLIFVCVLPATKPRTQRPGGTEEGGVGTLLMRMEVGPQDCPLAPFLRDLGRVFLTMPAPGKLAARTSGAGTGRKSAPPTVREGRDCERPLWLPA